MVVGSYFDTSNLQHGFIYRPNSTFTSFDAPLTGSGGTEITGINNLGDIIGVGNGQPFVVVNGSIDTLFGERPTSINDNEQILLPVGYHGNDILDYRTNTLQILDVSGNGGITRSQSTFNNSGIIVGGNSGLELIPTPEPGTFLLALPACALWAFAVKLRKGAMLP